MAQKTRLVCTINTAYGGSTLMSIVLNSHPAVCSIGEGINPRIFLTHKADTYPCSCGAVLLECPFWKSLVQRMNSRGFENFDIRQLRLGFKFGNRLLNRLYFKVTPNFAPLYSCLDSNRIKRIRQVNLEYFKAALEETGSDVFFFAGKNLIGHYQYTRMPELDVRFIRITRDVRSFVNSYKKRGRSIKDAIRIWVNYNTNANMFVERHVDESRVLTIKYEQLYRDPKQYFAALHRFMGVRELPIPEEFSPRDQHITGNALRLESAIKINLVERDEHSLSRDEMDSVMRSAGVLNERLGYE